MSEKILVKRFKKFSRCCFLLTFLLSILKIINFIKLKWYIIILTLISPLLIIISVIVFFIIGWLLVFLTINKE